VFRTARPTGHVDDADLLRAAARGSDELLREVARLLLDADSADAVRALGEAPRLILRLDERARHAAWPATTPTPPVFVATAAARLRDGDAGPVAIALAGMHPDGRVRETATGRMADDRDPMWIPFLMLRAGEWVREVRERARAAVMEALPAADAPQLGAALDMALTLQLRERAGFVHAQAVAALVTARPPVRDALLMSGPAYRRGFVFTLGNGLGWWSPEQLAQLARGDRDRAVRNGAAEAICRAAVWSGRDDQLRALTRSRYSQVRALALTGLVRLGRHGTAAGFLDDPGDLVRAIARDAARRAGVDAVAHYRAALTAGGTPELGAIAGLAETGADRDAPLLHGLLGHPDARVRAAAVRGLCHLGVPPVPVLLSLLRDPAAAVVREAAIALSPLPRAVPDALIPELLADPRVELRRAGYRLARARGTEAGLRAGLALIDDPDAFLAGRVRADVTETTRRAGHYVRRASPR
jgi:hypothetical protein